MTPGRVTHDAPSRRLTGGLRELARDRRAVGVVVVVASLVIPTLAVILSRTDVSTGDVALIELRWCRNLSQPVEDTLQG